MAKKEIITSDELEFRARAAFVRLAEPKPFDGKGDPRYETTFLLDPADPKQLEGIKLIITTAAALSEKAFGVIPLALRRIAHQFIPGQPAPDPKLPEDGIELCFEHGDTKDALGYVGYKGMFVVPSHNTYKPTVVGRNGKAVLPGEEGYPYSGSYVRGKITLWMQENSYGKAVRNNLRGVQFARDGEPFSKAQIETDFTPIEDDEVVGAGDKPVF